MVPRMRMDIQPRCDKHPNSLMSPVAVQLQVDDDKPFWIPAFACGEADCSRLYNSNHGYFYFVDNYIDRDAKLRVLCPHDELAMYIAQFEPQGLVLIWRCAQVGCQGSHLTKGALGLDPPTSAPLH